MKNDFSSLLSKYFNQYLPVELGASTHTMRSYRKTFSLLLEYMVNEKGINIRNIDFNVITRDVIVNFLNDLETSKGNSINTRNQRLGAIKSFYQYASVEAIENIANAKQILNTKSKKFQVKEIDYLTLDEYKEVLNSIDVTSKIGRRNYLIITLIYEGALRSDEVRHINLEDLRLENKTILINGKGNKQRYMCITENTVRLITDYININNIKSSYLFIKNNPEKRSSFIEYIVKSIMKKTNIKKNVTPHTFRHSRAIHLLENGVDIVTIRNILGHSSIQTTEHYARVTEKHKMEVLQKANEFLEQPNLPDWTDDNDLLSLLINL